MQIIRINRALAPCAALLALHAPATAAPNPSLHIAAEVSQHGAQSGITNTSFTAWLPPKTGFAGLNGALSLTGNSPAFSEALVLLGTTPDDRAACTRRNATTSPAVPPVSRLWAGILKSNETATVTLPVAFTLPHAVSAQAAGACLVTVISAGYPYLDRAAARYTRTTAHLNIVLAPIQNATAQIIAIGLGGEFRIAAHPGTTLATYVGMRANQNLTLDAIATATSAAPVTGAPAARNWTQAPTEDWRANTDFVYIPAPICAAAHFDTQPGNKILSILRMPKPAPLQIPPGAVPLAHTALPSHATVSIQRTAFNQFAPAPPKGFTGTLSPGDCLVAYDSATSANGTATLDVENQSTVYLRKEAK